MTPHTSPEKLSIGFVGQGWVGKHVADDFEARGFDIVRYSKEAPHDTAENKKKISQCDIVFVAVPTPTTERGSDSSIVENALTLVGKGKIAVIKSSILPGVTDMLQKRFPDIVVFHAPEFLTEANAAYDAGHPSRTIIGIPETQDSQRAKIYAEKAHVLLSVLPHAPHEFLVSASEAEMIKYLSNCFLALKVVYSNIGYDMAEALGCDYSRIADALGADERIGTSHLAISHKNKGRGAGGNCFIKDLAAFTHLAETVLGHSRALDVLRSVENKNIELLATSGKDIGLLEGVYGKDVVKKFTK